MPNNDDKFQAFLRESVSPESSSSLQEPVVEALKPPRLWWLKDGSKHKTAQGSQEEKQATLSTHSSTTSSMAEFLEKERMCREGSKTNLTPTAVVDSSSTTLVDNYSDEFTDDDISSIMDQISQHAGSGQDCSEKSIDDILREAEEVVRSSQGRQKSLNKEKKEIDLSAESIPSPLLKPSLQLVSTNLQEKKSNSTNTNKDHNLDLNRIDAEHVGALRGSIDEDANKIFELVDEEVKRKIAAGKTAKQDSMNKEPLQTDSVNLSTKSSDHSKVKKVEPAKRSFSPFHGELSTVLEESDSSLEEPVKGSQSSKSSQDTSSRRNAAFSFEKELIEERQKYQQLKSEMEQKVLGYKNQVDSMAHKYEEERFVLEKDVFLLRAKLTEMEQHRNEYDQGGGDAGQVRDKPVSDHRLKLLQGEVEKQERLIVAYQKENVKLCDAMKQMKVGSRFILLN